MFCIHRDYMYADFSLSVTDIYTRAMSSLDPYGSDTRSNGFNEIGSYKDSAETKSV